MANDGSNTVKLTLAMLSISQFLIVAEKCVWTAVWSKMSSIKQQTSRGMCRCHGCAAAVEGW